MLTDKAVTWGFIGTFCSLKVVICCLSSSNFALGAAGSSSRNNYVCIWALFQIEVLILGIDRPAMQNLSGRFSTSASHQGAVGVFEVDSGICRRLNVCYSIDGNMSCEVRNSKRLRTNLIGNNQDLHYSPTSMSTTRYTIARSSEPQPHSC